MINQLFLFAHVADTAIAIPTDELEAVVHLGEIIPVARTASFVRGLAALRSRVLTVIDARARITGDLFALGTAPLAILKPSVICPAFHAPPTCRFPSRSSRARSTS